MAIILKILGVGLAIALIMLIVAQAKNNAEVTRIWKSLETPTSASEPFTQEMIAELPEPVQRYFLHAIAPGTPLATSVHLTMSGTMRLAPGQDWMPIRAEELLSHRGFVWQAIAGEGWMKMRGADYYTQGNGRMRFSLWGLVPVVNVHNPDVMRSAIGRWIGEYFWLPSALLPQKGVRWKAIDANMIQADLKADSEPITLTFVIDDRGRLLRSSLLRWGNQTEDKNYANIPFGGEYLAEQTFGGYTIPSRMGAGWWFGTERYFEFFRVTLEQTRFQ
jgi:hypothetical protein